MRSVTSLLIFALAVGCAGSKSKRPERVPAEAVHDFVVLEPGLAAEEFVEFELGGLESEERGEPEQIVHVVALKHAKAEDLVATLQELREAARYCAVWRGCALPHPGMEGKMWAATRAPSDPWVEVSDDPGTNSIVLSTRDAWDLRNLLELIDRLDEDAKQR